MKTKPLIEFVLIFAFLETILMTPWINSDSLVIPKLIMMLIFASIFLPNLIKSIIYHPKILQFKVLILIAFFIMLQMIISVIRSSAPIEQQIFGRTGRGLGLLTYVSLIIIFLIVAINSNLDYAKKIIRYFIYAVIVTSCYAIIQFLGVDIIKWNTRTNGIIGTLGNPNFQAAIAAMAVIPTFTLFKFEKKKSNVLVILLTFILLYTLYICNATQGYIVLFISFFVFLIIYFKFQNKLFFYLFSVIGFVFLVCTILGMANRGPLSYYLYKTSIQSRGEFWRTSVSAIRENWLTGVGLDSFADVSTIYKSKQDALGINEFTDNSHNYYLEFGVTGGVPLMLLNLALVIITIYSFLFLLKIRNKFDSNLAAIFSAWIGFQAQALVSPASIPILVWGYIFSGYIIGLYLAEKSTLHVRKISYTESRLTAAGILLSIFSVLVTYPLFNADRLQLKSLNTRDAILAVKSAQMYPESVTRYSRIGIELLNSNLPEQALIVARSAVKYNPNSVATWVLLLANPSASIWERTKAQSEILRLDPYNEEIKAIKIDTSITSENENK